jgi:hypothetical protein
MEIAGVGQVAYAFEHLLFRQAIFRHPFFIEGVARSIDYFIQSSEYFVL